MRPVNTGNGAGYNPRDTLSFKSTASDNLKLLGYCPIDNTKGKFSLTDCLAAWLRYRQTELERIHSKKKTKSATWTALVQVKNAIENQVGTIYKTAAVPLSEQLGTFCSYCGQPLYTSVEVEHVLPKANYPTFSTSWKNFVLACGPCNGKKGKSDKPSRSEAILWTNKTNPTEGELYTAIRAHYSWPDTQPMAYRWMPVRLGWVKNGSWIEFSASESVNLNNIILSTSLSTRKVIAQVYINNIPKQGEVQAQVVYDKSKPTAFAMKGMVNLNLIGNTANTYDRRMMNRTVAWFHILGLIKVFSQVKMNAQTWQTLLLMARVTGFYSTWVSVLNLSNLKFDQTKWVDKFVSDSASFKNPDFFPNTVTTDVP